MEYAAIEMKYDNKNSNESNHSIFALIIGAITILMIL